MDNLNICDQIIFLYCADLPAAAAFYEETLGFPLVQDQGSCRIVKVAAGGGGYLGYCQRQVPEQRRERVIITLVVESQAEVDAWYGKLMEKGVEILEAPRHNPDYNIYHFFFQDPDGYTLEIQYFLDPLWKS